MACFVSHVGPTSHSFPLFRVSQSLENPVLFFFFFFFFSFSQLSTHLVPPHLSFPYFTLSHFSALSHLSPRNQKLERTNDVKKSDGPFEPSPVFPTKTVVVQALSDHFFCKLRPPLDPNLVQKCSPPSYLQLNIVHFGKKRESYNDLKFAQKFLREPSFPMDPLPFKLFSDRLRLSFGFLKSINMFYTSLSSF